MAHAPEKLKLSYTDYLSICIGRAIGKLYWVMVGWWVDAPIARRHERQFARDIRESLPFLFEKRGAEIVPNEGVRFPPPFDYALVTVAIGHLLLRFVRGNEEFNVLVASRRGLRDRSDWKDLKSVRTVLDTSEDSESSVRIRNLSDAGDLLRNELGRLQDATSGNQWDLVKRKVNALYPLPTRIW